MAREPLLIFYRGDPIALNPGMSDFDPMYSFNCPKCGTRGSMVLDPVDGHGVVKNVRGGVDISPSIVCGTNCGWHVLVENSVARDV